MAGARSTARESWGCECRNAPKGQGMNSRLCTTLGIDFPLFAFSHCRDVVAAVSKAGGFGVFGAASFSPDELKTELAWIDAHIDDRPWCVDLLIPENLAVRTEPGATARDAAAQIPEQHRRFVADLLRRFDIDPARPVTMTALANADAPVPLQSLLSGPAMQRIDAAVAGGNDKARALVNYYVGQGVGLVQDVRSCRSVVQDFMTEFAAALEDLQALAGA